MEEGEKFCLVTLVCGYSHPKGAYLQLPCVLFLLENDPQLWDLSECDFSGFDHQFARKSQCQIFQNRLKKRKDFTKHY